MKDPCFPYYYKNQDDYMANIMYIIDSLRIGGAEELLLTVAKKTDRQKYNISVVCLFDEGPLANEIRTTGVKVEFLRMRSRYDLPTFIKLVRLIRNEDIKIVHTHLFDSNFFGRMAAKLAGVPVIVATEHNVYSWKKRRHIFVDRLMARFTDRIIAVSEAVKAWTVKHENIDLEKFVTIYNGIDVSRFALPINVDEKKKELRLDPRFPVIGTVGTLTEQKGHKYLLEALAKVTEVIPDVKLLIVGDGHLRTELEELSAEFGVGENVIFCGCRRDIPEILAILDLFVLSSLGEGLSLVTLEAQVCGKPVVASNVDGIPEAVNDGQTGLLVPPEDPERLATAIITLLQDRELAMKMGEAGRRLVRKKFTSEIMVRKMEELYGSLLKSKLDARL